MADNFVIANCNTVPWGCGVVQLINSQIPDPQVAGSDFLEKLLIAFTCCSFNDALHIVHYILSKCEMNERIIKIRVSNLLCSLQ